MIQPARRQRENLPRGKAAAVGAFVTAAAVTGLLHLGAAEPGQAPATQPAVSEQVASELRAANAARLQLLQAEQDWALEKERLELLKSTVLGQAKRLEAQAAAAGAEEARLAEQMSAARAKPQRLREVEAMADTLAERLERALAGLAGRVLPGLVPPDRAAGITDPAERLAAAADRLAQARRQGRRSGVEIVTGSLAGETLTVKLLRAGAVAGWWCSLDGARSGQAGVREGRLILTSAPTPRDAEAIRRALAIAEGQAAPAWVLLPARQVALPSQAPEKR